MSIYNKEYEKSKIRSKDKFSTKEMAIAGMLGGLSLVLSMTPIGYIPIPILGINATTMHIPVIIGAILGGPMIGTFVGIIFGISSMLRAGNPFFTDPRVALLPRLFIGVFTYYSYKLTKSSIIGAIVGSMTNTLGVLSMIYILGYLPWEAVVGIAGINGITESIVSSLIVYGVVKSMDNINKKI